MPGFAKTLVAGLFACAAFVSTLPAAYSAEATPVGAWRATDECFLAIFVLSEGGRAQAVYRSGERDENAAWTWEGGTLTITSSMFPEDHFDGHLADDLVEADYVWHDLDRDQLNRQACVFERVMPMRI